MFVFDPDGHRDGCQTAELERFERSEFLRLGLWVSRPSGDGGRTCIFVNRGPK